MLAASEAVGPSGSVRGVDIAPSLLSLASTRCANLSNVAIQNADAQTAVLPTGHDIAISRFGVMFFSDTPAAFRNIAAALKPSGRIAMAAWGPAPENPYFMTAAKAVRETLGEMPKIDRTEPGPFAFEDAARVRTFLTQAGLQNIEIDTVSCPLTPPGSLADFAELALSIGPAAGGMAHFEANQAHREQLRGALMDQFSDCQTPDGLRIPAQIHAITAKV